MAVMRLVLFVGLIILIAGVSYWTAFRQFSLSLAEESANRSLLYLAGVRAARDRLAHLPRNLAIHPDVLKPLKTSDEAVGDRSAAIADFNETLKAIADQAEADALYIMDVTGTTIAASNFATEGSFVGRNYGFRPYFKEAIEGRDAQYFAVGATTGRAGYFVSTPIRDGDRIVGVSVVKTEFEEMLDDWQAGGDLVAVTDENDIIILASEPAMLNKSVSPLTPERLEALRESRQYGTRQIVELGISDSQSGFGERVTLDERDYHVTSITVPGTGWTLHHLVSLSTVHASALAASGMATLAFCLLSLGGLYAYTRQKQRELQFEAREAQVIRKINQELRTEIRVRQDTEVQLREMQDELVTTARLAALGKMSAAIVHEVNQPVSAINNYAASGALMLKRGDYSGLEKALVQIRSMTGRLGNITSDLLIFSRKPVTSRVQVDLNRVIGEVVEQLQAGDVLRGVELDTNLSSDTPPVPGKLARMEQLISNLVRNAAQAALENPTENNEATAVPRVVIRTHGSGGTAVVEVEDNGCGIADEVRAQMFEPFFTTKPVGQGIGLGLAICFAIVEEAGGRIEAENRTTRSGKVSGAVFRVKLPCSDASSGANGTIVEEAPDTGAAKREVENV